LKRRVILILASICDNLKQQHGDDAVSEVIDTILEIGLADQDDLCIRMTCLKFIYNFYNDFYLKQEKYKQYLNKILKLASSTLHALDMNQNHDATDEVLKLYKVLAEKYAGKSKTTNSIEFNNDFVEQTLETVIHFEGFFRPQPMEYDSLSLVKQSIIKILA